MKKRIQNNVQRKRPYEANRFSISIGGLDITRRSEAELVVLLPTSLETLQRVVVNGEIFHRNGLLREVVRVAPVKYPDAHLRGVNRLVSHKHYSKEAAIKEVAELNGYEQDNFRRAYYARKGSLLGEEEP
jgi:hypothetical protein